MSTYPQDNSVQWLDLAHRQTDNHNYPRSLINVSLCGNVHLITAHWWAAAGSNWTVNTNTVSAGGNQSDVFKSAKKRNSKKHLIIIRCAAIALIVSSSATPSQRRHSRPPIESNLIVTEHTTNQKKYYWRSSAKTRAHLSFFSFSCKWPAINKALKAGWSALALRRNWCQMLQKLPIRTANYHRMMSLKTLTVLCLLQQQQPKIFARGNISTIITTITTTSKTTVDYLKCDWH